MRLSHGRWERLRHSSWRRLSHSRWNGLSHRSWKWLGHSRWKKLGHRRWKVLAPGVKWCNLIFRIIGIHNVLCKVRMLSVNVDEIVTLFVKKLLNIYT